MKNTTARNEDHKIKTSTSERRMFLKKSVQNSLALALTLPAISHAQSLAELRAALNKLVATPNTPAINSPTWISTVNVAEVDPVAMGKNKISSFSVGGCFLDLNKVGTQPLPFPISSSSQNSATQAQVASLIPQISELFKLKPGVFFVNDKDTPNCYPLPKEFTGLPDGVLLIGSTLAGKATETSVQLAKYQPKSDAKNPGGGAAGTSYPGLNAANSAQANGNKPTKESEAQIASAKSLSNTFSESVLTRILLTHEFTHLLQFSLPSTPFVSIIHSELLCDFVALSLTTQLASSLGQQSAMGWATGAYLELMNSSAHGTNHHGSISLRQQVALAALKFTMNQLENATPITPLSAIRAGTSYLGSVKLT